MRELKLATWGKQVNQNQAVALQVRQGRRQAEIVRRGFYLQRDIDGLTAGDRKRQKRTSLAGRLEQEVVDLHRGALL